MNYGKFFKQARIGSKLTQQYVADKLQIRQSNVSDWENDVSRPEYEKLVELAKLYQVSIYDLPGGSRRGTILISARNATVQPINKATYVVAEKTDSIF